MTMIIMNNNNEQQHPCYITPATKEFVPNDSARGICEVQYTQPQHLPVRGGCETLPPPLGRAGSSLGRAVSSVGRAVSSLGRAVSSLGRAVFSLGRVGSSLGRAVSFLGRAGSSLGRAGSSLRFSVCTLTHCGSTVYTDKGAFPVPEADLSAATRIGSRLITHHFHILLFLAHL